MCIRCILRHGLVLYLCVLPGLAFSDSGSAAPRDELAYTWHSLGHDSQLIGWELGTVFAATSAIGFTSWDWATSSFRFENEGWFGDSTKSGGTDKLGHAFTAYTMSNAFAERMMAEGAEPRSAALSGALLAQGLTLYVEIFDGMSNAYGFAYEDAVMNFLGGSLAYLRQRYPVIKNVVDYRLEYDPSGYEGYDPLGDYAGQKYLLAFKFVETDSFLRYFELQAGYYARGFTRAEVVDSIAIKRYSFVGIGINFAEVFVGPASQRDTAGEKVGGFVLEHIQLPETSARKKARVVVACFDLGGVACCRNPRNPPLVALAAPFNKGAGRVC